MKNKPTTILLILLSIINLQCSSSQEDIPQSPTIDQEATKETQALYRNLMKVQQSGKTLFAHQEATLYGRKWSGDADRSDVKDIVGTHPAMIGLDFGSSTSTYEDGKQRIIQEVKNTYRRGGVVTFAWHASNPANDGSFYWEQNPVKVIPNILQGGNMHSKYTAYLDSVASMADKFRTAEGTLIPVIFRPFHEYDGDWFWWGKGHCTTEEFIQLWRFTVDYLRTHRGVHNFIYAFSPDCRFTTQEEFLTHYPGDNYVDMLGMDNYWDFKPDGANNPQLAAAKMQIVADIASKKNKLVALTETGLEGVTQANWFTATLLPIIKKINLSYVLVWRNATDMEHHYYAPDKGHPAEEDFKKFCEDEQIVMEKDLPKMYQ